MTERGLVTQSSERLGQWRRDVDLGIRDFVVLVTGGSDGLGAAAASALLEEGARVAICARDRGRLEDRAGQLRQKSGDVLAVGAEVTHPRARREFVGPTP